MSKLKSFCPGAHKLSGLGAWELAGAAAVEIVVEISGDAGEVSLVGDKKTIRAGGPGSAFVITAHSNLLQDTHLASNLIFIYQCQNIASH